MGFLSKIFKGVKKVFKKIGKGIKKVAGKIGKFMGKIGIVGQIALSFLLPGIGALLGKAAVGMMGSTNALISGAGKFLNAAVKIGSKAGSLVKSVGEGVTKVIGKTIGATINAVPGGKAFTGFLKDVTNGKLDFVGDKFLGKDGSLLGDGGVLGTAKESVLNIKSATTDLFSKSTVDSSLNKFAVEANTSAQISKNLKDTPQVSADEYTANLQKGQGPIEALSPPELVPGQARPLNISVDDITSNKDLSLGIPEVKPLTLAEQTRLAEIKAQPFTAADQARLAEIQGEPFTTADQARFDSLLAPSPIKAAPIPDPTRLLTAEELAEGYSLKLEKDNSLTITDPKPSLGSRILNSNPVTRAKAKTTGKLTAANVLRASAETFGAAGQAADGAYDYTQYDIPDLDQEGVVQGGRAEGLVAMIRPFEVQGYSGSGIYTPQSSWSRTMAGLTQQTA